MYPKQIKYSISLLLICFLGLSTSCDKNDDLPPNHAKGKIIAITGMCYGEIVLIEVEDPKGIGESDHFSTTDGNIDISYNNAIAVPYFSKIGISNSVPQIVGTELYFEYRELTNEERGQSLLFNSNPPPRCNANIASPPANPLIITKVINYK